MAFRYVIDTSHINSSPLFRTGSGVVWQWTDATGRQSAALSRLFAPPARSYARRGPWATGALARSIDHDTPLSSYRRVIVDIGSSSTHALYVHEGTATPITAGGKSMPIKRYGKTVATAKSVRGQRANPFLWDGLTTTLRRKRVL